MPYIYHKGTYWNLGLAQITPVNTSGDLAALLKFPTGDEFTVQYDDARAALDHAIRNLASSVHGNGNGKVKPKRLISEDKLNRMRSTQSQRKKEWWDAHPERWSSKRREAAGVA